MRSAVGVSSLAITSFGGDPCSTSGAFRIKVCQWPRPIHAQYRPLERSISGYHGVLLMTQSSRSTVTYSSGNETESLTMDGLPVFQVVGDALVEIRTKWRALLKALIIPALFITAVESIPVFFPDFALWSIVYWVLTAPFYVLFAVICHRVVILGEAALPSSIGIFWSERETRFFGWTLALIIVTWGMGFLIGLVALVLPTSLFGASTPWLPLAVVALTVSYFYGRLSLVFPATAVDKNTSLDDAMHLSTGNGLRILAAVVIPSLLILIPTYLISGFISDPNGIASFVLGEIAAYALMVITICVISVTYRVLAGLDLIDAVESSQ